MKFTAQMVPEAINNYNAYNGDGDRMIGVTGETQLMEMVARVVEISGAGISGSYNAVVIGHFDSMTQTVNFRVLTKEGMVDLAPGKTVRLNLRGALQYKDSATNESGEVGVRYVIGGQVRQLSPGTLNPGNPMSASVQIDVTYALFEFDSEPCIEIDKLNSVYRVDGKDLMENIRKLC